MKTNLENQNQRKIKYIYPVESSETIAKMISALANSEGGELQLGVDSDGINVKVKGYSFDVPNHEVLSKILGGFESFTINTNIIDGLKVVEIKVQKSQLGIKFKGLLYEFCNDYSNEMREIKRVKIFISYNHATSELADIIQKNIEDSYRLRVVINRDTQLGYRDDIDKFMQSIKENDIIISLVTRKYLESEACMYEVTELMRDADYTRKLAFIILSEEDLKYINATFKKEELLPEIYGAQRFDYITYWDRKKESYTNRLKMLTENSPTAVKELSEQINRVGKITDGMGPFLKSLNDLKGKDFDTMYNEEFIEIKKMIEVKISK